MTRRLIIPSRSPVHFAATLALAASSMSVEVSALPGELEGLTAADDGLPALGEGWASSACVFGGDEGGAFVQAVVTKNSMTPKASKFWTRVPSHSRF